METPLLIGILTALATAIGWLVVVHIRRNSSVDAEIAALRILFEKESIKAALQEEENVRKHNRMVIDVATMQRELSDKIERQNIINMSVQQVMHELQITLTKLDVSIGHFNKLVDHLILDIKTQKEIIDELRFKK